MSDQLDIRDESVADALRLVLYVEGKPWASASASSDVVEDMRAQLGVSIDVIKGTLKTALIDIQQAALEKVSIDKVKANPTGSRRFVAAYVLRDFPDVTTGLVWYDVSTGETGPEHVPPLVRNKLRYVVHEQLVAGDDAAQDLLGFFR